MNRNKEQLMDINNKKSLLASAKATSVHNLANQNTYPIYIAEYHLVYMPKELSSALIEVPYQIGKLNEVDTTIGTTRGKNKHKIEDWLGNGQDKDMRTKLLHELQDFRGNLPKYIAESHYIKVTDHHRYHHNADFDQLNGDPALTERGLEHVARMTNQQREKRFEENAKANGIDKYPKALRNIYLKADKVLNSDLTGFQIEKHTGLHHSNVYRMRHPRGNQGRSHGLRRARIATLLLLAGYPNKSLTRKFNSSMSKNELDAYLYISAQKNHFNLDGIKTVIANLFASTQNVSELSRKINMTRSKLSHIKHGRYDLYRLHPDDIAKLVNAWHHKEAQGAKPAF